MTNPRNFVRLALVLMAGASLAACATVQPRYPNQAAGPPKTSGQGAYKVGAPYQVAGIWYVPKEDPNYDQKGIASWYGDAFHMKATANGEVFDMNAVSAAHTTLPLPSMVEVTNLDNGRKLVVRVNDRGPFVGNRIIDLSRAAAQELGYDRAGLANVRVRYVGPAPLTGPAAGIQYAQKGPLPTRLPASRVATPALPAAAAAASTAKAAADPVMELAAGTPVRAPEAVSTSTLPPLTGSAISDTPIPPPPGAAPAVVPPAAPLRAAMATATPGLRVQAGAFSSEATAQRAVSQLAPAGQAAIEPVQRGDGLTLYRVVMPAPADEAEAYALRDRVAEIGFTDARVVRTF